MTKIQLQKAYEAMMQMIETRGQEFPTAHENTCTKFNLTEAQGDTLKEMFDAHCGE